MSTQTVDDSLVATIRMVTGELIAKTNLLHQKDQKYIEMMEQYYVERERLRAENGAKDLQIAQLNERIDAFQNIPLVPIEVDGKMISRRIITKMIVKLPRRCIFFQWTNGIQTICKRRMMET